MGFIEKTALRHDDDVYYYMRWRLKLEGETENMCVWTKKRGSREKVERERRWVLLKIPRCDIDGLGEEQ